MGSHKNGFAVRDARNGERAAIRALTLAAYQEYETMMPALLWTRYRQGIVATLDEEGPADRIVAEQDGDLLGSVLLYPPAAKAYGGAGSSVAWPEVRLLAVVPAARGHGVGKALMEECIRRARSAGASTLGLHTMDVMQAAVRMYERMGFVRVPDNDFTPVPGVVVKAYRLDLAGNATIQS